MQTTVLEPHIEARVRDSFARQGFMSHVGAEMTRVKYGEVEIRAGYREHLTQQHAFFHGGVSAALADSACGYAAFTTMAADSSVIAVEFKINFVAPAEGESLVARARVVRAGKTLKICAADVFGVKSGAEKLCATMLATIMELPGRSDRPNAAK